MIPPTKNGLPAMACLSAMQKCIRRNMEHEAMEFACELLLTSKGFCTMVVNRLQIISHEDIDIEADTTIVPFVFTATEQAKTWWDANPMKQGKSRIAIGSAIRLMARAKKSREGDHFQAAVGLASVIEGYVPEIPDWADDMHTLRGKRLGRDIKHFLKESVKLVPRPRSGDVYQDEAHRLWNVKEKMSK